MEKTPFTKCQLFGTVLLLLILELILVSTHWQPIFVDLALFKIEESKLESHSFWFVHAPTMFMTSLFFTSIMQGWLELPDVFFLFKAKTLCLWLLHLRQFSIFTEVCFAHFLGFFFVWIE